MTNPQHSIWDHQHPDFPNVKDTLEECLQILKNDGTQVLGVKLETEQSPDIEFTTITGFTLITESSGTWGILVLDRDGMGIRDSLVYGV